MNRPFSLAMFSGGILLIILGFVANDSTSSDISGLLFHGSANNNSIWFLVGGIAAVIIGLNGLSRGVKARHGSFSKVTDSTSEKYR